MHQGFVVMPFLPFGGHPAAIEQQTVAVALAFDHGDALERAGFLHQHPAFQAVAHAVVVLIDPAAVGLGCAAHGPLVL